LVTLQLMLAFWRCSGRTHIWRGYRPLSRQSSRLVGEHHLIFTTFIMLIKVIVLLLFG
jgi:hypothetical protein